MSGRANVAKRTGAGSRSGRTRERLLEATLTSLREHGFAGTTAASIAEIGGLNQALAFYHFGSLAGLLAAAGQHGSEARRVRYRSAFADVRSVPDALQLGVDLFREDVAVGHNRVLAELVVGAGTSAELRTVMIEELRAWTDLARELLDRFLAGSPLAALLPPTPQLARLIVSIFVGVELVGQLDDELSAEGPLTDLGSLIANLSRLLPIWGTPPSVDAEPGLSTGLSTGRNTNVERS